VTQQIPPYPGPQQPQPYAQQPQPQYAQPNYLQHPYQQPYQQQLPMQQEPPQPAQWEGSPEDIFATRRPSISWGTVREPVPFGTRRLLAVYSAPRVEQGRKYGTNVLDTWPDGNPKFQVVIGVIGEDGEEYGYYMGRPSAATAAMKSAQDATGVPVELGTLIDVTYTHDQQGPDKSKEPAKQFTIALYPYETGKQYMSPAQRLAIERKMTVSEAAAPPPPPVGGFAPETVAAQPVPSYTPVTEDPWAMPPRQNTANVATPQRVTVTGPMPPMNPVAAQGVPATFEGYTVELLAVLGVLEPHQLSSLGHDAGKVASAVAQAKAAGALPPF